MKVKLVEGVIRYNKEQKAGWMDSFELTGVEGRLVWVRRSFVKFTMDLACGPESVAWVGKDTHKCRLSISRRRG